MNWKIIIFVICSILLIFLFMFILAKEINRTSLIPLSFSEISKIERSQGTNDYSLTLYYASINDVCMNIFEAYNLSKKYYGNKEVGLARELEIHMDPALKQYKHNIPDLLSNIEVLSSKIENKLSNLIKIDSLSLKIKDNLYHSWDEDHHDVTHLETRTRTYADSKGESHTETYTVEVYDYTIHTYTFNESCAIEADKKCQEMNLIPFEIPEILKKASFTGADGEYAVSSSWKELRREKSSLKQDDIEKIILNWPDRTFYSKNINEIFSIFSTIKSSSYQVYAVSYPKSKSIKYRTCSHYDDGPEEFQINRRFLNEISHLSSLIQSIAQPIFTIKSQTKELHKNLELYIEKVLNKNNKKISASELKFSIINMSKNWYTSIFKENFIKNYFDWRVAVVLAGIAVLLIAGLFLFIKI